MYANLVQEKRLKLSRFIEFNNPPVQYLTIEDHVNAYVVGDLHGCYEELMKELDRINFDKSRDILICVGDLIDRGKSSEKIIALLDEPWFVSVLEITNNFVCKVM